MLTKVLFKAEKILAILTVFLLPTQLALHFWPAYSFVFGIRVDFLSPSIYLTDILVLCLVVLWYINDRKPFLSFFKENKFIILIFLLFSLVNLFFSTSFWVSFWKWLKVVEMILFAFYIYFRKSFVGVKKLYNSLFLSSVIFSLIGIIQFLLGRTTGFFYLFGERSFSSATPGIALVEIFGRDYIRTYSTFPHPNSLAGFLGAVILLLIYERTALKKKWFLTLFVYLLCFLLTFSLSATLALITAILLFKIIWGKNIERKIVLIVCIFSLTLSLLLPLLPRNYYTHLGFLEKKYTERIDLAYISGEMIGSRFLLGEGLNTFIVNIPKFKGTLTYSWILQPVHNIFLLIFSETGALGLTIYFLLFLKLLRTKLSLIFIFILITGMFDHYWLTLQQNILLFSFLIGLSLRRLKR